MKRRVLYIRYCLMLGLYTKVLQLPQEWLYDYEKASNSDILAVMASILANRGGDQHQYSIRYQNVRNKRLQKLDQDRLVKLEAFFASRVF